MATTEANKIPVFQYTQPTVAVDGYVFDATALNAYIKRAASAYGKGNIQYCVGSNCQDKGKGQPDHDANTDMVLDCSGYAYWSTFRKGIYAHTEGPYWVRISQPIPGATVRYDRKPGATYGHSGFVVAPGDTPDNFKTLDSTSVGSIKPPTGSIRFLNDGKTKWVTKGGPNLQFLVSPEAIISVNGVPYKQKSVNLLLEAAKRPITTTLGLGLLVLLGYYIFYQKVMKPKIEQVRLERLGRA